MFDLEEFLNQKEDDELKNLVFLDIETGDGFINPALKKILRREIEIDVENYTGNPNWKPETLEQKKGEKLVKALEKLGKGSALDPFQNRICILGMLMKVDNDLWKYEQITELDYESEAILVEKFVELAEKGKCFVTFNGETFDLLTLRTKAVKHELSLPKIRYIDLMQDLKYWNTFENRYMVLSQDKYAAIFGVVPNRIKVNPVEIGNVFSRAKIEGDNKEVMEEVQKIMEYSKEDLRVLRDLYLKLRKAMFIRERHG